jgi:single-stranded-DNA-specific exonuclease
MRRGGYRWTEPAVVDEDQISSISNSFDISPVLAGILIRRGYSEPEEIRQFLHLDISSSNDPFLMKDMDVAVKRIVTAVEKGERVLIYGDYDVDGLTSAALLVRVLGYLGLPVHHHIPNRLSDGYGVSSAGINHAKELGATLVITVDCGIAAHEEIRLANSFGLDVIVTDHHEPGQKRPDAVAVLNPKQTDCPYPDNELAGIGVAFKFCQGVFRRLQKDETYLHGYLDLVALGTIADVAPIIGENRLLVAKGLEVLQNDPSPALAALLRTSGLMGKVLTTSHVAFTLAPRINAVGRMGDSQNVVNFLTTDHPQEAAEMAMVLEQENRKRQRVDSRVLIEAREKLAEFDPERDFAIVLASRDWHQGVLGIVASRLVEQFYRPVVLLTLDEDGVGRGSARSIQSFHLYDSLTSCRDLLLEYGGHQYAAGIRIKEENIDKFRQKLNQQAKVNLTEPSFVKELTIDADVTMDEVNTDLYADMQLLAPNGPANPRPLLLMRGLTVDGYPRMVGEGHLKMKIKSGGRTIDAIGFNLGEMAEDLSTNAGPVDMVFTLDKNTWQGVTGLQAKIKDLKINSANKNSRGSI